MQTIPSDILTQFEAVLKKRAVPVSRHTNYRKWLRYYLDFRVKYTLPDSKSEHVRLFIEKLQKKNQTPEQQTQAAHALSLFFESLNADTKAATISTSSQYLATTRGLPLQVSGAATSPSTPRSESMFSHTDRRASSTFTKVESSNNLSKAEVTTPIYSPLPDMQQPHCVLKTEPAIPQRSDMSPTGHGDLKISAPQASSRPLVTPLSAGNRYNEWRCLDKSKSPEWDKIIDNLAAEIKIRRYSRKTLKAYADWSRKFQSYLRNKPPDELSATDAVFSFSVLPNHHSCFAGILTIKIAPPPSLPIT
ncbi:MAG: phage integrase N-terminal SAM-like domain-containing protein [Pseudomonadota bacterium]